MFLVREAGIKSAAGEETSLQHPRRQQRSQRGRLLMIETQEAPNSCRQQSQFERSLSFAVHTDYANRPND